jgi:hypothetical protein
MLYNFFKMQIKNFFFLLFFRQKNEKEIQR